MQELSAVLFLVLEEKHNTPNSLVYDTGTAKITQILKCTTCKSLECIEEENKKVKQWGEAFTKININIKYIYIFIIQKYDISKCFRIFTDKLTLSTKETLSLSHVSRTSHDLAIFRSASLLWFLN